MTEKSIRRELEKNETLLQDILDVLTTGVILIDGSGRITFANRRMTELFRYREDQMIGMGYTQLLIEAESEEANEKIFQMINGDMDTVYLERIYQRSDGSTFPGLLSGRKLCHPDGSFQALVGSITDITESKEIKKELRRSETLHRTLIDTIPDLMWLKDETGVFLSCNQMFERFFGAEESEIIGKTDYDFVEKSLADFFKSNDQRAMKAGRPSVNEEELVFADTGYRGIFETIKTPMYDADGRITGILGIARDISQRKETEKTLLLSQQKVEMYSLKTPLAVIELDPAFNIQTWNPSAEKIFGYTQTEIQGRPILKIIPKEDQDHYKTLLGTILHNKKSTRDTIRNLHRNGDILFCEWFSTPLVDEAGQIISIAILGQDITRKILAENALKTNEKWYREFFDNMPSGIAVHKVEKETGKFLIKDFNEAAEKICGVTRDDVLGKEPSKVFPGLDESGIIDILTRVHRTGEPARELPAFFYKDDKRQMWVEYNAYKMPSGEIVSVFNDVTDRKVLQAEAIRAGHLASIGELAAGVAHEINNPVTGIIGIAEILSDKFEALGGDRKIPDMIIHEGERISKIVKNLLAFARVKSDDYGLVGINETVSMSLELVEKQIFKDGIHLSVDLMPDLPKIRANDQEILQVFLNIISNARYSLNQKYPDPDPDKMFDISTGRYRLGDDEYIRITFFDKGTGIPQKGIDSITDPFFSTKPRKEGTGLGLSISHGIVKTHGGRLLFDSKEDEYAKVIVDLPIEKDTGTKPHSPVSG